MRIVSLLPSATEIVYALGLQDELEGVTHECDYPPEATHKPVISNSSLPLDAGLSASQIDRLVAEKIARGEPLYTLDEDRIRALQPDLILAQDLCRVCAVPSGQVSDALAKLGSSAQVVSLDPNTLDDVLAGLEEVARATGREERAQEVISELRGRVETVREKSVRLPRVRALAMEWADPPFVGGHWVPEMVAIAGGEDPLGVVGKPSRRLTWDELATAAPEVIVFMPCGYTFEHATEDAEALLDVPAVAMTPAASTGRVFAVDASSYFSRPGPRIVDGLELLAWALHPEVFREPPKGRISRVGSARRPRAAART